MKYGEDSKLRVSSSKLQMREKARVEAARRGVGRGRPVPAFVLVVGMLFLTSWIPSLLYRDWTVANLPLIPTPTPTLSATNINTQTISNHSHNTNINSYTHATNTSFHAMNRQATDTFTLKHATDYKSNNRTNNINVLSNITNVHVNITNIHAFTTSTTTTTTTFTSYQQRSYNYKESSVPPEGFDAQCSEQYQKEGPRRQVVLWTPFWHTWEGWKGMMRAHGALKEGRCPVWRCEFLWGPEVTAAQAKEADAVIFFSLDVFSRPLPPRSPHALWIWLELEAPVISQQATAAWNQLERAGVFFNLTMSYHRLNPVTALLGQLVPLSTPQHCPLSTPFYFDASSPTFASYSHHMHEFDAWLRKNDQTLDGRLRAERYRRHGGLIHWSGNRTILEEPLPDDYSENTTQSNENPLMKNSEMTLTEEESVLAMRPRLAAWMASHCPTDSRREAIVVALQRFIAITTVGKCGDLRCGKNYQDTYCYRWLAASHLFYLSFENALCDDYHTEKLWIALKHGMVPVVYGGPSYRHILPFGSYIEVSNFSNAAALATHLLYLASHPSAYLRHLQWRRYWRVRWPVPWCGLCHALHRQAQHAHTTLDQWWNSTATCYDPIPW